MFLDISTLLGIRFKTRFQNNLDPGGRDKHGGGESLSMYLKLSTPLQTPVRDV